MYTYEEYSLLVSKRLELIKFYSNYVDSKFEDRFTLANFKIKLMTLELKYNIYGRENGVVGYDDQLWKLDKSIENIINNDILEFCQLEIELYEFVNKINREIMVRNPLYAQHLQKTGKLIIDSNDNAPVQYNNIIRPTEIIVGVAKR